MTKLFDFANKISKQINHDLIIKKIEEQNKIIKYQKIIIIILVFMNI